MNYSTGMCDMEYFGKNKFVSKQVYYTASQVLREYWIFKVIIKY